MVKTTVVVGMSGGVDSAVAACLLQQQGYHVVGVFMKNWEDDDTDEYCSSRQDLIDAVAVADKIGIDIEAVNFSAEYRDRVFANFLDEYRAGRTPNPDVFCNAEIKFKAFLDHALNLGADYIATGHYAKVRHCEGSYRLLRADDRNKDQSYFLYRLNQAQLAKTLFPLGEIDKREVREIARGRGLPNFAKKDSTGICFIGERPFREFLKRYFPIERGEICTLEGKVIGEHIGLMYYTLGQRSGLGIGGAGEAWYVAAKEIAGNRLIVVQGREHPALLRSRSTSSDLSWISGAAPPPGIYSAKTRYRQKDAACRLVSRDAHGAAVEFIKPQWAVTPGQSLVIYDGEVCLGGGIVA